MVTLFERFARLGSTYRPPERRGRALWMNDDGSLARTDLLALDDGDSAALRRGRRTPADLVAMHSALYAAVRLRSRALTRFEFMVTRTVRGRTVDLPEHPALAALRQVNAGITGLAGMALIETHKLTTGAAVWVKRRNALGVPVEFEIWDPRAVEVIADRTDYWRPAAFRWWKPNGSTVTVAAEDVLYLRHFIDPRNVLYSLSPIGAVRVQVDTGLEAQRFNLKFFDNDGLPAAILSAEDAGQGEVQRLEHEIGRRFQGTDNKHRVMIATSKLDATVLPVSHRDMEFLEQQRWGVEEVARVMEMNPTLLGANQNATDNNSDNYDAAFWDMMYDQARMLAAELTEFFLVPDFGPEFAIVARATGIPALQEDQERSARIAEIHLRNGVTVINEVRAAAGLDAVPWGDAPLVATTLTPLERLLNPPEPPPAPAPAPATSGPMPMEPEHQPEPEMEPRAYRRAAESLDEHEARMQRGWERRLGAEMRALFRHLDAEADGPGRGMAAPVPGIATSANVYGHRRALEASDVHSYDWAGWWDRYGAEVARELAVAYESVLAEAGFVAGPAIDAHQLALRWAERRAAELLALEGRHSVAAHTYRRVLEVVKDGIEKGESIRQIKNRLRADPLSFDARRAETIARTETAVVQGEGKLQAFQSIGYEGKRWLTAHDERVDMGNASGPCILNEQDGPIRLGAPFSSGHATVPAHPRCRCTILPVTKLPVKA